MVVHLDEQMAATMVVMTVAERADYSVVLMVESKVVGSVDAMDDERADEMAGQTDDE